VSRARILVADDDHLTRDLVATVLAGAGREVLQAADGPSALRELYASRPDLLALDVEMPKMDGWATLERVRDLSDVPVLMLTARASELERVRGLRAGADDYLVKPFGNQELAARVQALLRRGGGRTARPENYKDALMSVDFAQRSVSCEGRQVALTPLEFALLRTLLEHPNQVLSREQLLELVWGDEYAVSPAEVKVYIGYLRRKLDPALPARAPIATTNEDAGNSLRSNFKGTPPSTGNEKEDPPGRAAEGQPQTGAPGPIS
jgi:DNA-binding response OmpR family regulator